MDPEDHIVKSLQTDIDQKQQMKYLNNVAGFDLVNSRPSKINKQNRLKKLSLAQQAQASSGKQMIKPGQNKLKINKIGEVYINAIPQVINAN